MSVRFKIVAAIVIAVFLLVQCTSQKKITYEFPAAMSEEVRTGYTEICEKGRVLYEINCAGCHNTKVRGKEIIPDFTQDQLVGYSIRVLNAQHEKSIPEEDVTPEELGLISTFLMYKKRNKTN